ncbi:unnamed protein product [Angiostrongylus costaricensis]|uniref:Uncharacterized protein n=1 Tax=Angiostrongylus costaricensis TaxID=334426 RepID=A0A0R3PQI7_ANGCS|nr:unnamed protein product [Angiostrongylus costaricensis]
MLVMIDITTTVIRNAQKINHMHFNCFPNSGIFRNFQISGSNFRWISESRPSYDSGSVPMPCQRRNESRALCDSDENEVTPQQYH